MLRIDVVNVQVLGDTHILWCEATSTYILKSACPSVLPPVRDKDLSTFVRPARIF